jgi:hypothetical protein
MSSFRSGTSAPDCESRSTNRETINRMGRAGHVGDALCTANEAEILYRGLDYDVF